MKKLFYTTCLVTLSFNSISAYAETVNYSEMENLFGEPVTTSATGKPQKASEAPTALEIITANQIRRMGVTSLPEVLGRMPGLVNWQATRSFGDVGVRGQNTAYNPTLLVLLNGRQVYVDSYGYTNWPLIPVQLEEIKQIEIVKGPTTALYGFNAVSGVVNIVTYNPQYDNVGEAGLTAGTGNYKRAYGYKTLKLSDKVSVRASGSVENFNEFDRVSDTGFAAFSNLQDGDNRKFLVDSLVQMTEKTQLRMEGSYAIADSNDIPTSFYAIPTDKTFWSGKASISSETDYGLVEANLYTNVFRSETGDTTLGKAFNQVTVAQLQDLFKIGADHTFRLQGEYRHNVLESSVYIGPDDAEISYDVFAAGGMWNWAITPDIEWTNALRLDHLTLSRNGIFNTAAPFTSNNEFDENITDYSANTGMVWKATPLDTFRASYARGIQAPSLFEFGIDYSLFGGTLAYVGNPDLDPVIVQNYEIGYDRSINYIDGKLRSSLFYKKTENISTLGGTAYVSGPVTVLQAAPIGNSDTLGAEFVLDGKVSSEWSWDLSYVYQTTNDDLTSYAATMPSPLSLHYENTVPHHIVKGHIGYATGAWETDLYVEGTSEFDSVSYNGTNYDIVKLDGYYTAGGRVAYTFKNDVTLALFGSELTQQRVTNNYGLENERRVFVSLSKKF